MTNNTDPVQALRRMVEKLAAHVRPTCGELWNEAQAVLTSVPTSAAVEVDFAAVASILRHALRDGVHAGYGRNFILQQASALEALSQQAAASSTPVRVDDALVAGAMEAAADACTHHVVCNEAITAAVEYALTSCNSEKPSCRHNFVWDEDNGGECCQKCGKVRVRQHAVPSEEAVATVIGYDPWSRVAVDWHRNDLVPGTKLYTAPQQPVGAEEVWLYKGSDGAWHTFHSEKHRLDTIADGGWDVRKFIALSQQPAASSTTVGVEWVLELADEYDTKGQHERAHYLRTLAQQHVAPTLAKHQPCGCVICTCEDEQQCQGCGAKHCGNRADHPPYVAQQPAHPSMEAIGDWVLVPRTPTLDMANAAWRELESQGIDPEDVEAPQVWDAMLAAAPQQPTAPSGEALRVWLRMKPDGTPDWAEDCIGSDDKFLDPEMASDGYYLQPLYAAPQQSAAVAAIQFALTDPEGITFLRLWNEGEFDTLRREWPDAPVEVYVGADPLTAQHREGE